MPPVARKGVDTCLGHGCWPTTNTNSGSDNVITNSYSTCRTGDTCVPHGEPCTPSPPHNRPIGQGSSTVFVNSRKIIRVGDPIDCGGTVIGSGSPDVIAGG